MGGRMFCERDYQQAWEKKAKLQYAYFHMKKSCIQKKFPDFEVKQFTITNETRNVEKLTSLGI